MIGIVGSVKLDRSNAGTIKGESKPFETDSYFRQAQSKSEQKLRGRDCSRRAEVLATTNLNTFELACEGHRRTW